MSKNSKHSHDNRGFEFTSAMIRKLLHHKQPLEGEVAEQYQALKQFTENQELTDHDFAIIVSSDELALHHLPKNKHLTVGNIADLTHESVMNRLGRESVAKSNMLLDLVEHPNLSEIHLRKLIQLGNHTREIMQERHIELVKRAILHKACTQDVVLKDIGSQSLMQYGEHIGADAMDRIREFKLEHIVAIPQ